MNRPLTSAMDNVDAWRLGECAHEASRAPAGDLIDTGLVLLRLLEEKGYELHKRPALETGVTHD